MDACSADSSAVVCLQDARGTNVRDQIDQRTAAIFSDVYFQPLGWAGQRSLPVLLRPWMRRTMSSVLILPAVGMHLGKSAAGSGGFRMRFIVVEAICSATENV